MISVIIPVFNTPSAWLGDCLESLRAQSCDDWEAIIADDCSAVPVSLDAFPGLSADSRFKVVRLDVNGGPAIARNEAVRHSCGGFLFTLDSDDALEPSALEKLHSALSENPSMDCVYPDFRVFGAVSTVWHTPVKTAADMIDGQWIPGPGTLMRRELFDKIGGFPDTSVFRSGNEDWEFWLTAAEKGFSACKVDEPLYRYRISSGSLSATLKRYSFSTIEAMFERHKAFIDQHGKAREFLHRGYLSSVEKCGKEDLSYVLRQGFRSSGSIQQAMALCGTYLKRYLKRIRHTGSEERHP